MQGFWVSDPNTGEESFVNYEDLDQETWQQLVRPIGGFIWSAEDFIRLRLVSSPFYVRDWLPKQGKAVFYAPAKSGKSLLAMQLARSVGTGSNFLGIPTTQAIVLYIQFELAEEVLLRRMLQVKKPYRNCFIGTSFSMQIDLPGGQEQLIRAMDAVKPGVLILDPLYKTMAGDENESSDMKSVTGFLDRVIEQYNCSVLVIHHAGKNVAQRGRGSSVLEGWVDSLIEMRRTGGDSERLTITLTPKMLRHAEIPPEPITARLSDTLEFETSSTPATVYQQIYTYFSTHKQDILTPEFIAEQLDGGSNTSIHEALSRLVEEGFIEREKKGHYRWKGG